MNNKYDKSRLFVPTGDTSAYLTTTLEPKKQTDIQQHDRSDLMERSNDIIVSQCVSLVGKLLLLTSR